MKRILVFLLALVFLSSLFFNVITLDAAKPSPVKLTTITGEIVKLNPGVPYNKEMPAIKTAKAAYILSGSINNINKYIGYSVEMKGNIVAGPQGIQFFNVKSYKIIKKPTSIPTSKATNPVIKAPTKAPVPTEIKTVTPSYTPEPNPSGPRNEILVGWLGILDPVKSRFILKTEKGVAYELMGEIKGLEKLEGKKLEVTGNYVYTLVATEFPLFSVISYKVIDEPVPTAAPAAVVITEKDNGGYVYVKKGDVVKLSLESNKTTGYSWSIDEPFDKTILLQTGYEYIIDQKDEEMVGAGGREVWTFNAVGAGTAVTYLSYSRSWESVSPAKSFKVKVIVDGLPTPTPSYEVLKGVLVVIKPTPVINEKLVNPYQFILRTEKGPFTLMGNIKGLEAYNGAEIEVTGKIADMTITPPYFDVISYVILTKPTPTPSYTVLKGALIVTKTEIITADKWTSSYEFTLKTEKGPFTLLGNTKGLEAYNGADIEVKGTISPLEIYPPYFNVISYAILTTPTVTPPTPTPSYDVLKGTLVVNKLEPVLSQVAMPLYEFLLKTETGPCKLIGNVKGLEKYDGALIEVTGKFGLTEEYPPKFNVLSYVIISTPTPTPSYDVLKGTLIVTATKPVETERIVAEYNFSLKTEKGPFTLQGNVKGLEKYNGAEIEVTVTISPLKIYPPIFNVVSYVVLPATPTPTLPGKTHTIISDKALYVSDPTLGIITANAQGNVTISWTDNTQNAFFKAKVTIPEMNSEYIYEFELVQATACDSYGIQGIFNVTRNGKLVAEKVTGSLYGLDAQVGSYFKFYSTGEKWHLSAYVTSRMDF